MVSEMGNKNHGAERTNGRKRKEELREIAETPLWIPFL